jgi:hypothetical protein
VAYIKATFQVEYTVLGLNKWLLQHQFSYKQHEGVLHKFDVDKTRLKPDTQNNKVPNHSQINEHNVMGLF